MTSPNEIVLSVMGEANPYLERLLTRILTTDQSETSQGCNAQQVRSKYSELFNQLSAAIERDKQEVIYGNESLKQQTLLINAILKEKLSDRNALDCSKRHKTLLACVLIILPLVTNLIQFAITRWVYG
jgi:cytochrome c-type biogenesis protein CcmH/NrfG